MTTLLIRHAECVASFDDAGRAKLWAHKAYPEDTHSAGTGMTTLALLVRRDEIERELLERVCRHTLDTGLRNVSFHRAQVLGPDRTGFLICPRQALRIFQMYGQRGKPMEVAMVVGAHPLITFAGAFVAPTASTR